MKRIIILVIILVFLLIGWSMFLLVGIKNPYIIHTNSAAVIKQVQSLQRLETATFTIEKVIDAGTSGNQFEQLLFGDKILLIAHGQVIAGFDLGSIDQKNVKITGKSITLTLPPPRILITKLDNAQTRVYDRKLGLLTKGDKDLESQARLAAEKSIQEAACQGGILKQAAENGKKQIKVLLESLQFSPVTIVVPEGAC